MQIDERTKLTLLFDAYGRLLSDRQFEVMDKLLNLDIGESEIAELENSSRQAVHDAITKAKKQLLEFETKCGFVKQKEELADELSSLCAKLSDSQMKSELKKIITKI